MQYSQQVRLDKPALFPSLLDHWLDPWNRRLHNTAVAFWWTIPVARLAMRLVCKQNSRFREKYWFKRWKNCQVESWAWCTVSLSPTFQKTKRLYFKTRFRPKPGRSLLFFLCSFLWFPHRLSIKWVRMTSSRGRINIWPLCLHCRRGKSEEISVRLRVCLHRGECLL